MEGLDANETRIVEMVFNAGRTQLSYTMIHDIVYPDKRNEVTYGAKNKNIYRLLQRPDAQEYWKELQSVADVEVKQKVGNVVQQIAERAADPMTRFSHLEHEMVERINEKTGEILGFDFYPVISDPSEISQELRPYIQSVQYEVSCGKFRIIPRNPYDEKTRAKYMDMLAKCAGSYQPERLELTGANGGPVESVNASMTATEAADLYRRAVRGKNK